MAMHTACSDDAVSTLASEIARLRTAPMAELRMRYRELHGRESRSRNRVALWRKVAWSLQAKEHGGLSIAARARLEELVAEVTPLLMGDKPPAKRLPTKPGMPTVGTVILRQWHGTERRVTVVEGGFALNGVTYPSATALARHVTGQHWNGLLWLGLAHRKAKAKR